MTKKAKVSVDINTLFMGDCLSQADKMAIAQSELFPIIAAIYNVSDKTIMCGPIAKDLNLPDRKGSLILSNSQGVPAFRLEFSEDYKKGKQISLSTIAGFSARDSEAISSCRAAYIVNSIKKGRLKSVVGNAAEDASHAIQRLMNDVIVDSLSAGFDRANSRVSMNLPEDDAIELVKMVAAGTTATSLPTANYQSIMSIYNKYKDKLNSVSDSQKRFTDFWSRNKWLMLFDPYNISNAHSVNNKKHEGGFMLLRINGARMAAAALDRLENRVVPNWHNAVESVTWYKNSPHDIDDPVIRTELLASIMMLKVHSGAKDTYPELTDATVKIYEDLGAFYRRGSWSELPVLVVE